MPVAQMGAAPAGEDRRRATLLALADDARPSFPLTFATALSSRPFPISCTCHLVIICPVRLCHAVRFVASFPVPSVVSGAAPRTHLPPLCGYYCCVHDCLWHRFVRPRGRHGWPSSRHDGAARRSWHAPWYAPRHAPNGFPWTWRTYGWHASHGNAPYGHVPSWHASHGNASRWPASSRHVPSWHAPSRRPSPRLPSPISGRAFLQVSAIFEMQI
jgi:hypothetical protein